MRHLGPLIALVAACGGPPPTSTFTVQVSADPALATPITTDDGWALTFTHVVVSPSSADVTGAITEPPKSRLVDLVATSRHTLTESSTVPKGTYDRIKLVVDRVMPEQNVNVASDVASRAGVRPLYVEGSATKGSTTRTFQLGFPRGATYAGCAPPVLAQGGETVTVDFVVHAQRLFLDDEGKLRFDAYALADTGPTDTLVTNREVEAVPTSTLPATQYGATPGTLFDVLTKRSLTLIGLGASGSCSGSAL